MDVLLSDNQELLRQRVSLTYPERERYLSKDKYIGVILTEALYCVLRGDLARSESLRNILVDHPKAKNFVFDQLYLEGLLEGSPTKMQAGIEGVASLKVHKRRQTQDETKLQFHWDNMLLSHYGIAYTKFAWLLGYELDIQAPLVRITKELWPVKPLASYDPCYDFLKVWTD